MLEHAGTYWAAANPATIVDRNTGKIWVFYIRARPHCSSENARPGTDDMQDLARWSADNGRTWSKDGLAGSSIFRMKFVPEAPRK